MIVSMTGFGAATGSFGDSEIAVEIRSVNGRHLKITNRLPECLQQHESDVERLVKAQVHRGTCTVHVSISAGPKKGRFELNSDLFRELWHSAWPIAQEFGVSRDAIASSLMQLPGMISDLKSEAAALPPFEAVESVCVAALREFDAFRVREGTAMQQELLRQVTFLIERTDEIASRLPGIIEAHRARLGERAKALADGILAPSQFSELTREVAQLADRCDINEEVTRLACHLVDFRTSVLEETNQGRKLDFLCQEIFREINTIGAKVNEIEMSRITIDIKNTVERMRELVQNVA